jgi:hypothetical protein
MQSRQCIQVIVVNIPSWWLIFDLSIVQTLVHTLVRNPLIRCTHHMVHLVYPLLEKFMSAIRTTQNAIMHVQVMHSIHLYYGVAVLIEHLV